MQVPAGQRMALLFLWQTFCPLGVIFWSKPYQRFAIKRMRRLAKGLEDLRKFRQLNKVGTVSGVSVSASTKVEDSRMEYHHQPALGNLPR